MACWGTEPWWNRGRAQAQVCARMPFFSCAVHARFMRELPPVFVHMLPRICMTDDRESPSGRPSSNIYIYIHIYIYIYIYIYPRAPLQR